MQKTKMVFTIGPASDNEEILSKFAEIGMNVARLNFSHGTQEEHGKKIALIKKISDKYNKAIAIMLDFKGPKIRTHNFENDKVLLKKGNKFTFVCEGQILGNNEKCSISYENLYKDVKVSDIILVDDGLLEFKIESIEDKAITCTILNNGYISNHKGINVPNVSIGLPAVTEKDKSDIIFGCSQGVDIIAASFIRKASDVLEVRKILESNGGENIQIISKIETQEGVDNIDAIIAVSDGIMVARGDMGVEIPIQKVPMLQKMIISKCNKAGKVVITATQMLNSMITNPRPTRAEASDVANAIFDGTDAIMLSGESASGDYPVESAEVMSDIAREAEENIDYEIQLNKIKEKSLTNVENAICLTACTTAQELNVNYIIATTQSGLTAKMISKYRPKCPIIAVTPKKSVARSLALSFGITTIISEKFLNTDDLIKQAIEKCLEAKLIKSGDLIIIAAGIPIGKAGTTNMMKVQVV